MITLTAHANGVTLSPSLLVGIITALGLLGGIGLGVKAFLERKNLRSRANNEDANATAIVVAAARELVDPLRKELANERTEHLRQRAEDNKRHTEEVEVERKKVAEVRSELTAALGDVQRLTAQVHELREEVSRLEARLQNC